MVGAVDGFDLCRRRRGQRDATRGRTWLPELESMWACCCRVSSRCYRGVWSGPGAGIGDRPARLGPGHQAHGRMVEAPQKAGCSTQAVLVSETCGDDSHLFAIYHSVRNIPRFSGCVCICSVQSTTPTSCPALALDNAFSRWPTPSTDISPHLPSRGFLPIADSSTGSST